MHKRKHTAFIKFAEISLKGIIDIIISMINNKSG
jgi:hypothetical protein